MNAVKATFGWLFRHGIIFLLIIAALAFYQFAWPKIASGSAGNAARAEWMSLDEVSAQIAKSRSDELAKFQAFRSTLEGDTESELQRSLTQRKSELAEVEQAIAARQGFFASISTSAILEREKLTILSRRLKAEIASIELVVDAKSRRRAMSKIAYPAASVVAQARAGCDNANRDAMAFNRKSNAEKEVRNRLRNEAANLSSEVRAKCGRYRDVSNARAQGLKAGRDAQAAYIAAQERLASIANSHVERVRSYSANVEGTTLKDLLTRALLILLGLIALPLVIRTFFYFVLAPIAERRATIRISVPGSADVPIAPVQQSRVSIPVTLGEGEELLVRQDYLQTSSLSGRKDTRWALDYRHILSSIATGLIFLTRIRGTGETTTVSAVRDPFAELAQIALPEGASLVLHPRALVAVGQPVGRTMRISSHWRLLSLNAWLTMQLRYMVFHGPGRLVVMGGRGVRVEQAERGRIFGQDQLAGFSADLGYSVTRTETFAPYFFGREALFKDKVQQGTGVLIIEEAPLSARSGKGIRRGLEGGFDATLKAFGL